MKLFGGKNKDPLAAYAKALTRAFDASGQVERIEQQGELLVMWRPGATDPMQLNLTSVFHDHQSLDEEDRPAAIESLVTAVLAEPVSEEFEDLLPLLLPVLRTDSWIGATGGMVASTPFLPFLRGVIAIDLPGRMAFITQEQLEGWGRSFDEVWEQALAHLQSVPLEVGVLTRGAATLRTPLEPEYSQSSWLLLPQRLAAVRHDVDGDLIVFVPARASMTMVGSTDLVSLEQALTLAGSDYAEDPRYISPAPYVLTQDGVAPWRVPADHPSHQAVEIAHAQLLSREYDNQAAVLDERFKQDGRDVYVSACLAFSRADGQVVTAGLWVDGVTDGLIPVTSHITFGGDGRDPVNVPWDAAREIVGELLTEEPGHLPPRWRYTSWPDDDTYARLVAAAVPD